MNFSRLNIVVPLHLFLEYTQVLGGEKQLLNLCWTMHVIVDIITLKYDLHMSSFAHYSGWKRGKYLVIMMVVRIFFADLYWNRNTTNYRHNHKYKYVAEIKLPFINIKYWNMLTNRMEIRLARVMVAYLWEEMWQLHASKKCYNEAQMPIYYWETMENPKHPKS